MGLYDRDYMRHRAPEEDWDRPVRKNKKWIMIVAVLVVLGFLLTLLR